MTSTIQAGVWIDHNKATIVQIEGSRQKSVVHLESGVEGHHKATGDKGSSRPAHVGGGRESKIDRQHEQHLARYYDRVIEAMTGTGDLLIVGPGEAKAELHKRLQQMGAVGKRKIDVQSADHMTEPQVIALVREHFAAKPVTKR